MAYILLKLLKNWRLWIIALIVFLLFTTYTMYVLFKHEKERANNAEIGRNEAIRISNGEQQETIRYKNKYNVEVVKTVNTLIDYKNFKKLSETKELQYLKQFNGLKRTLKNLESVNNIDMSIMIDSSKYVYSSYECDSLKKIKIITYTVNDMYNDISIKCIDTPKIVIKAPIYVIRLYEYKHRFLFIRWKKQWTTQATSPNKLVRIDSQVIYTIKQK